jgi:hypothetical protein
MDAKSVVSDLLEKWNAGLDKGNWPVVGIPGAFACVMDGRYGICVTCETPLEKTLRRGQLKLEAGHIDEQEVLMLSCGDRSLIKAMPWLCYEVLTLGQNGLWSAEHLNEHIKAWAKLLRSGRDNEVSGLAGELFVMHQLVQEFGPEAWSWWVGPQGAIHDIVAPNFRIEVKTMMKRAGWHVTMHNLHQTSAADDATLFFDCVRLERSTKGGVTIKDLLEDVPSGIFPEQQRRDLAKKGDLDGPKFRFLEAKQFKVDANFPHIKAKDFVGGTLPPRVIGLEYVVDLGGLEAETLDLTFPQDAS